MVMSSTGVPTTIRPLRSPELSLDPGGGELVRQSHIPRGARGLPSNCGRAGARRGGAASHSSVSIVAAVDVATGQVVAERIAHNDSAHFTGFLALSTAAPTRPCASTPVALRLRAAEPALGLVSTRCVTCSQLSWPFVRPEATPSPKIESQRRVEAAPLKRPAVLRPAEGRPNISITDWSPSSYWWVDIDTGRPASKLAYSHSWRRCQSRGAAYG